MYATKFLCSMVAMEFVCISGATTNAPPNLLI